MDKEEDLESSAAVTRAAGGKTESGSLQKNPNSYYSKYFEAILKM